MKVVVDDEESKNENGHCFLLGWKVADQPAARQEQSQQFTRSELKTSRPPWWLAPREVSALARIVSLSAIESDSAGKAKQERREGNETLN